MHCHSDRREESAFRRQRQEKGYPVYVAPSRPQDATNPHLYTASVIPSPIGRGFWRAAVRLPTAVILMRGREDKKPILSAAVAPAPSTSSGQALRKSREGRAPAAVILSAVEKPGHPPTRQFSRVSPVSRYRRSRLETTGSSQDYPARTQCTHNHLEFLRCYRLQPP